MTGKQAVADSLTYHNPGFAAAARDRAEAAENVAPLRPGPGRMFDSIPDSALIEIAIRPVGDLPRVGQNLVQPLFPALEPGFAGHQVSYRRREFFATSGGPRQDGGVLEGAGGGPAQPERGDGDHVEGDVEPAALAADQQQGVGEEGDDAGDQRDRAQRSGQDLADDRDPAHSQGECSGDRGYPAGYLGDAAQQPGVLVDEVRDVIPGTIGQPVPADHIADQRGCVMGCGITDLLRVSQQAPGGGKLVRRTVETALQRCDLRRFPRPDRQMAG